MFFFSLLLYVIASVLSYYISFFILFSLIIIVPLTYYWTKNKKTILIGLSLSIIFLLIPFILDKINNIEFENINGIVTQKKESYYIILTKYGRFIIYDKNDNINICSLIKINGSSSSIYQKHYESSFDFIYYLRSKGISKQIIIKDSTIIFSGFNLISKYNNFITKYLDNDTRDIVNSLLFGNRINDEEIYDSIQNLELVTILSLSGFHLNKISNILNNLLTRKKKLNKRIIPIVIFLFFSILSCFKFSMMRLLIYNLLVFITNKTKKNITTFDCLSLTCFIILLLKPYSVISSSFYYSFPFIFYNRLFPLKQNNNIFLLLRIFIFYFPFHLLSNNSISLINPFFQLFLSPLIIFIFAYSLLLLFIPVAGYLLNYIVKFLIILCTFFNKINITMYSGKITFLFFLIFYIFLLVYNILSYYKFKRIYKAGFPLFILFNASLFIPDFLPKYEVHFIDVDQGDCTLIRNNKLNILIDTGGIVNVDLACESLIPYFRKLKISKIDTVILTHLDYDHYGALESLQNNFDVLNVLQVEDIISTNNTFVLDNFQIINLNDYDLNLTKDKNYHSGVYKFRIKNSSFLIMGDAPKEIEYKIINDHKDVDVDYLKVGHHGSKTSTSDELVKLASPKEAIISCGLNNRYKFPHTEVIETLNKYNVKIRRTDIEGTIVYKM